MIPKSSAPLLAVLLSSFVLAADDKEALKLAEKHLRGNTEDVVRDGAERCLALNSVAAVELLLDVLDGQQPHFRDIVWEVLPQITDPYARRRIQQELTSSKNMRVREWCAELLGRYGDRGLAAPLEKAVGEKDDAVKIAAALAVGRLRFAPAAPKLERLVTDRDPRVRSSAMEALTRIDPARFRKVYDASLADEDGGVRCALLGIAPEVYPDELEGLASRFLGDPDWRPRLQAVDHLARIQTATAVDALIRASGDGRPTVAGAATNVLRTLSGTKFTSQAEWEQWWASNRATFGFTLGPPAPQDLAAGSSRAKWLGLEVTSDHVAFVIDKSADMGAPIGGGKKKDDRAQQELGETLERLLGEPFTFNVITYGDELRRFKKEPVLLDRKSMKAALDFTAGVRPLGKKAIWEVLESVVSDPTLDTIYLLSSGEPEVGLYVHWNRVTEHLLELNRHHKVTIHTVSYTDSQWYQDQMERIALATGGQFKAHK